MAASAEHLNQFVTSTTKLLTRMKYYGRGDVSKHALLKVIMKYSCFINTSCDSCTPCQQKIANLLAALEASSPDICYIRPNFSSSPLISEANSGTINGVVMNRPPTVDNSTVNVGDDPFVFSYSSFTNNFSDPDGDTYLTIRIVSLPLSGTLTYNGVAVVAGQEFDNPELLVFTRENSLETTTILQFQISDNNSNKLFSNMAQVTLVVLAAENQPPSQVGDNTITMAALGSYTFVGADFTTETTPPYVDPEGDPPATLKITTLPAAGMTFQLSGVNVVVNQIIPWADVLGGNLKVVDTVGGSAHNFNFNYEIADSGSGIYVG